MCPNCNEAQEIIKRGHYRRLSDHKIIQRFKCKKCLKSFSLQSFSYDFRLRKRHLNQGVFRLLSKGMSQRGCAEVLGVDPKTIARRITRFGKCAKQQLRLSQSRVRGVQAVVFDEMESFEHSKLKPLTIALAVEHKSRRILALEVGKIAAKGHLADISRRKYGKRMCERKKILEEFFSRLSPMLDPRCHLSSDESQHYPKVLRKHLGIALHKTYKSRRATITGQGEMKKGGFDPLFCINQTAAMIRDNVKRMSRRTWCTTKLIERLVDLLYIYAFYHNQRIDQVRRPRIFNVPLSFAMPI